MDAQTDVVVIGAAGSQAAALFEAASRATDLTRWTAVDRDWQPERRAYVERFGVRIESCDLLAEPERLRELVGSAQVATNLAGPFYRTGSAVLDACIAVKTDYVDICDDADATLLLLAKDAEARAAGVRALICMGSSPGISNVLIRTAVDAMGKADSVDINWITDVADLSEAASRHFWHIFSLVDSQGARQPVQTWETLSRRTVTFPDPVGEHEVVELAHPEPITIPRFLPVGTVRNFGGMAPLDVLWVNWALARMGAGTDLTVELEGVRHQVADLASALMGAYTENRISTPYIGGGMVIDVHTEGCGFRFASGDTMSMAESTGTPAAAGTLLMLSGRVPGPGVFAPECMRPADFFPMLGTVSRSSGSMALYRLLDGEPVERLRIRDLFAETLPSS